MDNISEESEAQAQAILTSISDQGALVFYEKVLTASDTAGSGRVVIPKAIAEQYFPRLEQPAGLPVRAVDPRAHEYTFKFRYWTNNQSRMYLLEGAGELHRQYAMSVGDVMVFAQKPDRTLVVAGRPATRNDVIRKAPVKRPATAVGEGPKSKGPKESRAKTPKGQAAGGSDAKRRSKPKTGPGTLSDLEPAVDGIFRAVLNSVPSTAASGITQAKSGRWSVTLNLAGELYCALFDTHEDAVEAFGASGLQTSSMPLPSAGVGLDVLQEGSMGQLPETGADLQGAGPGQAAAAAGAGGAVGVTQGQQQEGEDVEMLEPGDEARDPAGEE